MPNFPVPHTAGELLVWIVGVLLSGGALGFYIARRKLASDIDNTESGTLRNVAEAGKFESETKRLEAETESKRIDNLCRILDWTEEESKRLVAKLALKDEIIEAQAKTIGDMKDSLESKDRYIEQLKQGRGNGKG